MLLKQDECGNLCFIGSWRWMTSCSPHADGDSAPMAKKMDGKKNATTIGIEPMTISILQGV